MSSGCRAVASLSSASVGSRPSQPLTRGADEGGAFLQAAADLDGAVVPQKAADLARDLRHGIGGKLRAVAQVEPGHGLEKAEAAELIQVVRVDAAPEKSPRDGPNEAGIRLDQRLSRLAVSVAGADEQLLLIHFFPPRRTIRRFIWTVVPLPGTELMRNSVIKLSMMVMPMPERSSLPVVNRVWMLGSR